MAVYVDDLLVALPNPKWPHKQHCHLVADTVEELHDFAHEIGLRRSWYQHTTVPHYDLTANKRKIAVNCGAVEITREQMRDHIHKYRITT